MHATHFAVIAGVALLLVSFAACSSDNSPLPSADPAEKLSPDTTRFPNGTELHIEGILLNTGCYDESGQPSAHATPSCAMEMTLKGFPVAVLPPDQPLQQAWILLTVPQILTDYMGQPVRVRGIVRGPGVLMPLRVEVEMNGAWQFIM